MGIKQKKGDVLPKKVTTIVSEEVREKMKQSGKSIYQFLQEAINEKLKNDQEKKERNQIETLIEHKLKDHKEDINRSLMKAIEVHLAERATVEKDLKEFLNYQVRTREAIGSALSAIKKTIEAKERR